MVESSLGEKVKVNGEIVYLDAPYILEYETEEDILEEAKHHGKNVKLNISSITTASNRSEYNLPFQFLPDGNAIHCKYFCTFSKV